LEAVGTLLEEADRSYTEGRRALSRSPGHARLPASVWLRRTVDWTSGGAQSVVGELVGSSSLAARGDVVLLTHALVLTPAPVPPAQGSTTGGTLQLPPTTRLSVTAVVADDGNVPERGVLVEVGLQPAGGGPTVQRSARVTVGANGAASVAVSPIPVAPAASYTLTVHVVSSAAPAGADTSDTLSIAIAPPAPAAVFSVSPVQGRPSGGTAVTIVGAGFSGVSTVDFGKAAAHFEIVSKSEVTAVAPPGSGTVTVTLVNAGGKSAASSASRFTYKQRSRAHTPSD
ncbi:MAG: IPT/TIG domain-containing protein, partial [Acidimicrobiales bacterium]